MNTTELPITALEPSSTNPRRTMDKTTISELAASIRTNGLLQPLLVRPLADAKGRYEVVCGNRRLLALREMGAEKCPAIVRELTDDEAADAQQVENLQRENVPPLEEGEAFTALVKKHGIDSVARRLGKTPAFIRRRMMLTRLTGKARKLLQNGNLPIKAAEMIAAIEDEALRKQLSEQLGDNGATAAEVAEYLQNELLRLAHAPFNKAKVYGCRNEEGRTCADCPFNTGAAQGQLFPELASEARCLHAKCFRAKAEADFRIKADAHVARGGGVLEADDVKKCWPWANNNYFSQTHFVPLEQLREALKSVKAEIEIKDILIARNPDTHEVRFVVSHRVAAEIWRREKALTPPETDNAGKEARRKDRIRAEHRRALRIAYVKALGAQPTLEAKLYPVLAAALASKLGYDQWRVLLAARSVERPKGFEQREALQRKLVGDLAKNQWAGFILQCVSLLVDVAEVGTSTRNLAAAVGLNGKKLDAAVSLQIKERFADRKPPAVAARNGHSVRAPRAAASTR